MERSHPFYPTVFLISALTCFFCVLHTQRHLSLRTEGLSLLTVALIIAGSILFTKYVLTSDPSIGSIVTRKEMNDHAEFSSEGRFRILPTSPLLDEAVRLSVEPLTKTIEYYPMKLRQLSLESLTMGRLSLSIKASLIVLAIYLTWETVRKRLFIPKKLLCLALSGIVLYQLADIFLFKLYLPDRYLLYSVPLTVLILVSIGMSHFLTQSGTGKRVKTIKFVLIIAIIAHFNTIHGLGLGDQSKNRLLYKYLETLPKDTLIAAHPYVADYIPTFSKRKVFINFELSHPWFDRYWDVIKSRTFEFFDAYYADSSAKIIAFCRKYHIDYLVVDMHHFTREFLQRKSIYFEPFGSYVKSITREKHEFALPHIPERHRLFRNGDIFVIHISALAV